MDIKTPFVPLSIATATAALISKILPKQLKYYSFYI